MSIRNWLQAQNKRSSKSKRRSAAGRHYRCRPALERLEDRIQPTTIIVTGSEDGPGTLTPGGVTVDFFDTTLRGAINEANADPGRDVFISFDSNLTLNGPVTISLSKDLGPLTITHDHVRINQDRQPVTVDGVQPDSTKASTGLVVTGADCDITLSIEHFADTGIDFKGPGATGNQIHAPQIVNNGTGVLIEGGASNNTVGAADAVPDLLQPPSADNPRIEDNTIGVEITGVDTTAGNIADTTGNIVEGNIIGAQSLYGVLLTDGAFGNTIGSQDTQPTDHSHGNLIEGNEEGVLMIRGAHDNTIGASVLSSGNQIKENRVAGVYMLASDNNKVQGNLIVSDSSGVIIGGASSNNTIGGALPNGIADNEFAGILMQTGATGNKIQSNIIGTADPTQFNGNGTGVLIQDGAINNTVGGTVAGAVNNIVGNTGPGIAIKGNGTSGNKVQGNRIGGVSQDTNVPLPNDTGVVISDGALGNLIGGTDPGGGNVISANSHDGIDIQGAATVNNVVQQNIIGADSSGQNPLPNGGDGVRIDTGANFNVIGTNLLDMPNAGNIIAFNQGVGVNVLGGITGLNSIRGNSIFDNTGLGIDLGGDGVTPNDDQDLDGGPNDLQNFPILTYQNPSTVGFQLNSLPGQTFVIDFYANKVPDPSGNGQGRDWLGSKTVTTDAAGNASDTFTFAPKAGEPYITATAALSALYLGSVTVTNDTSEFSAAVTHSGMRRINGALQINLDDGQFFGMARDPLFPQFLDLTFDKDSVSIDPSVFRQIDVTGAAGSTIDIEDVPAGLPVTVTGVAGNQIVNLSPSAKNLGHIQSPLSVHGDKSALTLNIYDQADPLPDVYTLTDTAFSDKQSAGISYDGISAINLVGSGLADTYNILNTVSSTTTAIYSNNGGDVVNVEATTGPLTVNLPASGNPTVHVSPAAHDLTTIQGNLNIVSQGVGSLVLDDGADKVGRNYKLTSTNLDWGSASSITFGKLGALTFDATAFNDIVTLRSLPDGSVTVNGGAGTNSFIGPDIDNTWLVGQIGVEGTLDYTLAFNSFVSVIGGLAKDRFVIPDGAYIPEFLSGGDGSGTNNTLDLSAWTSPLTVHVGTYVYGGTVPGIVHAFALCPNVIGGQSDDRFLFDQGYGLTTVDGGPGNNTLDFSPYHLGSLAVGIHGHNSGLIGGIIGAFSNIQNLIGGQTNDRFAFRGTAYLDGTIDGQGGANSISYTQSAASVSVNLQTGAASYANLQGGSVPQPGGIANIQSFVGGPGSANTLIAADTSNSWSLTGPSSGSVNAFTFQGFQNLTGGAAADTFAFQQSGSVSGNLDGGGGVNALDYSRYTGNITVDLALNLASLVHQGAAGSVWHIANVTGSIGNDLLVGDANANGLIGGTGRNILIGGKGSDKLDASGSTSDNLLIGGWTDYDTWLAALDAIFAEWTRTDLGFRDRFSDLLTGSNSKGSTVLNVVGGQMILLTAATNPKSNNGTVHADTSPDTLIGSNQTDPSTSQRAHNVFFSDADDVLVNFLNSSDQRRKVT